MDSGLEVEFGVTEDEQREFDKQIKAEEKVRVKKKGRKKDADCSSAASSHSSKSHSHSRRRRKPRDDDDVVMEDVSLERSRSGGSDSGNGSSSNLGGRTRSRSRSRSPLVFRNVVIREGSSSFDRDRTPILDSADKERKLTFPHETFSGTGRVIVNRPPLLEIADDRTGFPIVGAACLVRPSDRSAWVGDEVDFKAFRSENAARDGFYAEAVYIKLRREEHPEPSPESILEGEGRIFYTGSRCSLLTDEKTGLVVFFYNSVMEPRGTFPVLNGRARFTARYDRKFIRKHKLETRWEADFVAHVYSHGRHADA